jgi:predicted CopG family antitoxin
MLNEDNITIILNFLDYKKLHKLKVLNKHFNEVIQSLIEKYVKNAILIQRFYKKRIINWNEIEDSSVCQNKNNLIRYYIKYYDVEYFLKFPEFMADKLNRPILKEYVLNNKTNKLSDVIKFLLLDNISISDIFFTGW